MLGLLVLFLRTEPGLAEGLFFTQALLEVLQSLVQLPLFQPLDKAQIQLLFELIQHLPRREPLCLLAGIGGGVAEIRELALAEEYL